MMKPDAVSRRLMGQVLSRFEAIANSKQPLL